MIFKEFEIYDNCEPAGVELPKIEVSGEELKSIDSKLNSKSSSLDILSSLSRKGIKDRGIDKYKNKKEYYDRAKYELDIFEELGFVDYILLNWDVIGFCHKEGIPVGNGRGSAAGSLILYLLGVTNVDPIPNGLFFERFVSKSRAKKVKDKSGKEFLVGSLLPDVDSDISYDQRQRVIEYIEKKHEGRTSKILTFNTFSSKLCIKEAVKYFEEAKEDEAGHVSDMIPKNHGIVMPLDKAIEESEQFEEWASEHKETFKNALKALNLNKNTGVHPSGIAICSQDIGDVMPLQITKEGALVSGYDMNGVADLMVKFDILGLRTLTIADNTCKKLGISLDDIDYQDPFIYQVLQDFNHPVGLFQISAETNFKVCQDVRPDCLQELSDVVALARPASLQFVSDYIDQKKDPMELGINEELDELLKESKNVTLYQETMMFIANEVFGMSLEEAELLRRVVGKKKVDEIPAWKEKIYKAAEEKGLSEDVANYFWSVVEAAGNYAFNKSHSVSYAILAAKTVYLKFKHPQEFFISVLEASEFEPEPLATVANVNQELRDFDIKLLPPSLEKSKMNFSIEGKDIRYGLNSIKGVSEKSLQALVDFRGQQFDNKYEVFIAAKECGLNISVLSALIQAGSMEESSKDRTRLVLEAQAFNLLTDREKRNFCKLGERFGYDVLNSIAEIVEKKIMGDDNRALMPDSRFTTFKKNFKKYREIYIHNKKFEKFANWWYETSLLGYSYSYSLRDCFSDEYGTMLNTEILGDMMERDSFKIAIQVTDVFVKRSQSNNKYMNILGSDEKGSVRFLFMDNRRATKLSDFQDAGGKVEKGDVLILTGSKSGDTFFVDKVRQIDTKIYMKAKDIKK
ncbi:DNA polymerase III subunit alpha [bacterium]|nr:DNA polymerase III subunit alpha [bacterium]